MSGLDNPWKTLSVRQIYRNAWIRLEHHDVLRPDGKQGVYGVVHFIHRALGVVVLDAEQHTWLVGQFRYPLGLYSWEIPEGGGKPHETPLDAIKRELEEETGIRARQWDCLGQLHTSNSVCNEAGMVFLARDLQIGIPQPEGSEVLQLRRLPFAEACAMALDGRITDCISVVGLLRARDFIYRDKG